MGILALTISTGFLCNSYIHKLLDKVENAGGKILESKSSMAFEIIAIIIDLEGNRIGLHAER